MDPEISKQLHENIYQTYNQLKSVLPKGILKLQVLKKERYPIIRPTLIKEIENDIHNKNRNYLSSSQKINIFYNDNIQKKQKIPNLFTKVKIIKKKEEGEKLNTHESTKLKLTKSQKQNSLYDNNEIITFKNFREKNMKILGVNCDVKIKRNKGMYNSFSVNDVDMKKNIYLPKIIDRMKYSIPRNLRNNQGLILLGNNVNDIVDKTKDITFINRKNRIPTDLFFYKLKKIKDIKKVNDKNIIKLKNNNKGNNNIYMSTDKNKSENFSILK